MAAGQRVTLGLALSTAALLLVLIVLGALVRGTDAELACNQTWLACDGRLWPGVGEPLAWLDWGHRFLALWVAMFSGFTWWAARRTCPERPDIQHAANLSLGLLGGQMVLGLGSMGGGWLATLPLLHLALAAMMLSCLVTIAVRLLYVPRPRWLLQRDTFPAAVHGVSLLTFLVIMTGGLVVGSETTGEDATAIHLVHRACVLMLGIAIGMLWWRVRGERPHEPGLQRGIVALAGLFGLQVLIGALYVYAGGHLALSAAHVLLAVLAWGLAVALSMAVLAQDRLTIDSYHLELE